jgi:calcium-dependent protein kinase
VILYVLIAGYPPFYGDTDAEIFDRIGACELDFEGEEWDNISDLVIDLI